MKSGFLDKLRVAQPPSGGTGYELHKTANARSPALIIK
jgi:hypothetical protein